MTVPFDDQLRHAREKMRSGDHEGLLRLALDARERFPDRASTTWLWIAAALAGAGRRDEALATVEDAVRQDLTWRLAMYESPALDPIRHDPRFLAAMELTRRRLREAAAHPQVGTWAPPERPDALPLLLCLHGANASGAQFTDLAPRLAESGWLVACAQSSQPAAPGRYCWDDPVRSDADVDAFLDLAGEHHRDRVAAVGFSQGATVAVRAALRGRASLGFVALAAGYSPSGLKALARLAATAGPVRGMICSGERDPYVDAAREAHDLLRRAGHHVQLEVIPGLGHSLSPEMTATLAEVLPELAER